MDTTTALAHISEDGLRVQTVAEHLQGTATLCEHFASVFDAEQAGYYTWLLHEIVKFSKAFQCRLKGGPKVDHSTAGAKEAFQHGQPCTAFAVAGHHAGLPDGGPRSDTDAEGTLLGRWWHPKNELTPGAARFCVPAWTPARPVSAACIP